MTDRNVQMPVSLIERLMLAASDFGVRDEEAVAIAYTLKSEHAPLLPASTPPSIANMAPGTTFVGTTRDTHYTSRWTRVADGLMSGMGIPHDIAEIDPSTIRDVTPPKDAA